MPTPYPGTSGVELSGPFNDNATFPGDIGANSRCAIAFRTHVSEVQDGESTHDSKWQFPVHSADVARGVRNQADFGVLVNFYRQRVGAGEGFRFRFPIDFTSAPNMRDAPDPENPDHRHLVGVGDGVANEWQALKRYWHTGYERVRPLTHLVDSWMIVDGVVVDSADIAWNLEAGVGSFDPGYVGKGSMVEWCGSHDVPVRFGKDVDVTYRVRTDAPKAPRPPPIELVEIRALRQWGMPRQNKGLLRWSPDHDMVLTLSRGMLQLIKPKVSGVTVYLPDLTNHPKGDEVLTIKNDGDRYPFRIADWLDRTIVTTLGPGTFTELLLREYA